MRRIVLAPELFRLQRAIVAQAMEVSLSNIESLIIAVETDPDLAAFALERVDRDGSSGRIAYGYTIEQLLQGPTRGEAMPLPPSGISFIGDLSALATEGLACPEYQVVLESSENLIVKRMVGSADPSRLQTRINSARVRKFVDYLRKQAAWIHDTVSSALLSIANYQKDFVKSLRVTDLRSLPISLVADVLALPHHASTYCRLLRRRTVEIVNESSTTVIPVQLLLRGHDVLERYEVVRRLNDLLLLEVRNRHALLDRECAAFLARHIPGGVPRRRIAEYRDEANIPTASMRLHEYANGRREPFIIHCDWEIWLKKPGSEVSDQSLNLG